MSSEKSKKNSLNNSLNNSSSAASSSNEDKTTGGQSTRLRTDVVLPQTKVKTIMKSSPEIEAIGVDCVFLITKATELFIDHLTTQANGACKGTKNVQYKNLADVVHKNSNMEFLRDIIPVKLPARVALAEVAKQTAMENKELLD